MDRTRVFGGEPERRRAVRRLKDGVALSLQRVARHSTNGYRILDQQHGFDALQGLLCHLRPRHAPGELVDPWEVYLERCPVTGLAVYPNEAAVLLDDPVDGGETEARALARFFRSEERLENMGLGCLVHPDTGVAHRQHHIPPRSAHCVIAQIGLV